MMMKQNFNRRHSPNRRKTLVPVQVEADGERFRAFVVDVSYEGMKLALREPLERGTPIAIEALGKTVPAIVHWYKSGHAGVHLLDRLDRNMLVALETADDDLAEYR